MTIYINYILVYYIRSDPLIQMTCPVLTSMYKKVYLKVGEVSARFLTVYNCTTYMGTTQVFPGSWVLQPLGNFPFDIPKLTHNFRYVASVAIYI